MSDGSPTIKRFAFNEVLINQPELMSYAREYWPVVYLLSDSRVKMAYVGETTDLFSRITAHLKTAGKNTLTEAHIISSDRFNKSATLDVESNLIKYISSDGRYQLLNANVGIANHNYYQKQWYWNLFQDIWNKLRSEGIAKHSLEFIDNSDLFKYSPYKSLTNDQKKSIVNILRGLLNQDVKNIVLEGGAGTGKTIIAVFLFKLLHTKREEFNFTEFGEDEQELVELAQAAKSKFPNAKMALVIPMSSFRRTIEKVFKNIKGLKSSMVIGPAALARERFDIVVVDEAHRLRRRVTLGTYFKNFDSVSASLGLDSKVHTELDWVCQQAIKSVLFYDNGQSIKPSDVLKEDFDKLKRMPGTVVQTLTSQLRVRGGRDYVNYVKQLLSSRLNHGETQFKSDKYEFSLFASISEMVQEIKKRNNEVGLSRLVAGYSWQWVSKNESSMNDIFIEDINLKWNSTNQDWVNSSNSINEVGCIHTTQGYDLNYTGVIFGREISYDEEKEEIIVLKNNYHDKNGKTGVSNDQQLKEYILNIYETLMLRAIKGTYVYVCDEKLRKYFAKHVQNFKGRLKTDLSLLNSNSDESKHRIPLYNLKAAAGTFSEEQKVENHIEIFLPSRYKSPESFFACIAIGESMNKIIPNGAVCLFQRYTGGSRNGKIVLVELRDVQDPDTNSVYTIKEYHSIKNTTEDGWFHESITLKPLTVADGYTDIRLQPSETEGLKVIGMFECVL